MPDSNPIPFGKLPAHWRTGFVFLAGCYPVTRRTWVELCRGSKQEMDQAHRKARACRASARNKMNWPEKLEGVMADGHIRFRQIQLPCTEGWQLIAEVLPGS